VRQASRLDEVLVATDDERIAAVVQAAGGIVAMTRPDHPSGTESRGGSGRGPAGRRDRQRGRATNPSSIRD